MFCREVTNLKIILGGLIFS